MARGINKVILIGNLGADPEVRYATNGNSITHLRVATSEAWKDKQTGAMQERTEWHRITLFNRLGEIASQYLRKGAKIYIEGSLRTSKWQDTNGQDRYSTDIIANSLQMLDGKSSGNFAPNDVPSTRSASMSSEHSGAEAMPELINSDFVDDEVPF